MKKRSTIYLSGLLLLVMAVWYFRGSRHGEPDRPPARAGTASRSGVPESDDRENVLADPIQRLPDADHMISSNPNDSSQDELAGDAMRIASEMTELLDEGDDAAALRCARDLAIHTNQQVRLMVLEGYEWIGTAALMDVVTFLDDSDREIREKAEEVFWSAIADLDDPVLKARLLNVSLETGWAELRLEILDELLTLPDTLAFEPIARMMDDPQPEVSDQASEYLELLSGEPFSSTAQAMEWFGLNSPDMESFGE